MKAAKVETAVNGFKKTGLYPLNPTVFSKADFATSNEHELQASATNSNNIGKRCFYIIFNF